MIMKAWFRYRNDPKRHRPLVTFTLGSWVATTWTDAEIALVRCFRTHAEALAQADVWANDYHATEIPA